jgi:hypothetical protein
MTSPDVAGVIRPDGKGPPDEPRQSDRRPTRALPTDRVQLSKQLNLLRAYAAVSGQSGKPVSSAEVANVAKLNTSTISLCNGFFADVGFIEKAPNGQYVPSPEVVSFLRAFAWSPETAPQKLAPRLRDAWFMRRLQPKLAMGGLDEDEAIRELGDEANADPRYTNSLRLIIDYLETTGLVRRDGNFLRAVDPAVGRSSETENVPREAATPGSFSGGDVTNTRTSAITTAFAQPTEGVVQFHISVKVDMAEFSDWSPDRITAFFGGIAQVLAAKGKLEKSAAG